MKEKHLIITDEAGLHARPASKISKTAAEQKGEITLTYEGKAIDLKSILAVMSLAVPSGGEVSLSVEGGDEEAIMQKLLDAFKEQEIDIKEK